MPSDITPSGGTKSTTTPLLIAFLPSLEVASAELRHMAQPWLKAGTPQSDSQRVRMTNRSLIALQDNLGRHQINQRKDEHPHQIDEVPVEPGNFDVSGIIDFGL